MEFTKEFVDYLYKFFVTHKDDICHSCKHNVICGESACEKYENFGSTNAKFFDNKGNEIPWNYELTCMDLDFGTCPRLKGSPCETCFDENISYFEWNGEIPDNYDSY